MSCEEPLEVAFLHLNPPATVLENCCWAVQPPTRHKEELDIGGGGGGSRLGHLSTNMIHNQITFSRRFAVDFYIRGEQVSRMCFKFEGVRRV